MKTLRELMTEEIKRNGWLDVEFKKAGKTNPDAYGRWLKFLSDQDFLSTYNRVHKAEENLD